MFGVGLGEFILILVVALLFISPEKLPEIAKVMGKTFNEFKKASAEARRAVSDISHEVAISGMEAEAQNAAPTKSSEDTGSGQKQAAKAPENESAHGKDVSSASPSNSAHEEKKG